ncbi:MAG: hypothetical protein GXP29_02025 [Planctomycetes bacterium]|nr:hypothetical protein [Planctomycetota bacterium]
MSIVVAVKKGDQVVLAADTMHSSGFRREHEDNVVARSKLRRVGRCCMGGVGWSVFDNILDHYLASLKRTPSLANEQKIFDFFLKFWKVIRKKYQVVNDQPDRDERSPFADIDSEFMVCNPGGIFAVSHDLTVMQFAQYAAIGSGEKYAYGALRTTYHSRRSAEQIACAAVEAAVHFEQSCGGSTEVIVLRSR